MQSTRLNGLTLPRLQKTLAIFVLLNFDFDLVIQLFVNNEQIQSLQTWAVSLHESFGYLHQSYSESI
jgi:hypothetical protein